MPLQSISHPGLEFVATGVASGVRWTAFWAAVALPFLHVPLLYMTNGYVEVLLALVVLNVVCLFIGHRYHRPGGR